ncbi:MAG TPA: DUF3000 domain-containing protein [Arachnia sp.]|nr:DUF3000 domain-containing protein [Arachnia sp.]HMR13184.1 DUF3000 domain-containing protein [Arachnia sp.]
MPANLTRPTPAAFTAAVDQLGAMAWRRGLSIDEIGSPQRIAPFSIAISGELADAVGEPVSNGRLILLHDPAGNTAWDGTFRIVTYVRAEVELEMVTDPLLPEVAWSWLTESLANHGCVAAALAGTVTASYGKGFGEMTDADRAEVELRSSWTPTLDALHGLTPHLSAWQELLGQIAGEPDLPPGIAALPLGRRA